MPDDCEIISILQHQSAAMRNLWCRECNLQFTMMLPATMRPAQVCCPGCQIDGFVVAQVQKHG